jgi:hypothetical protein
MVVKTLPTKKKKKILKFSSLCALTFSSLHLFFFFRALIAHPNVIPQKPQVTFLYKTPLYRKSFHIRGSCQTL